MSREMEIRKRLAALTDDELVCSLKSLVADERAGLVSILHHLAEFEKRKLAADKGFPSLFDYCVRELRYAQGESLRRIKAARAAEKYPILYRILERGTLSLTTVTLLEPHLKWNNYRKLIRSSKGLSTREVEALVASLAPIAAAPPERIRFLAVAVDVAPPPDVEDLFSPLKAPPSQNEPAPQNAPTSQNEPASARESAPAIEAASPPVNSPPAIDSDSSPSVDATPPPPAVPAAEAPAAKSAPPAPTAPPPPAPPPPAVRRVQFSFTADEALLRDFERAKDLSRHKWPAGRQEDVFAGALKALLERIDPDRRSAKRARRRAIAAAARSRTITGAVKDEVWRRDEGRCSFASPDGRICGARAGLEFDHVRPWALGGSSLDPANVRLLCRAHNDLEARRAFGGAAIDAAIAAARRREPCGGG